MQVGDYVRTKDGRISIIEDIDRNGLYILKDYDYSYKNDWLIKSSPDIIDLIEVGDYVNGYRVVYIEHLQDKVAQIHLDANDLFEQDIYREQDIKSIVTKEQFKQMEYEVE